MVKGGRGTLEITDSNGHITRMATLTCCHCQKIVVLNMERKRDRGYCANCHAYRCDNPGCVQHCTPIEKCIELAQKFPGLPILGRSKAGELMVDPEVLKIGKVY